MSRAYWVPCGLVALLLVGASLLAPFNHDEDQYYGAAFALSEGRLYGDFIYLQTPLHAVLGNALVKLSPGNSLWLLRISQGLMGAAVFSLVLRENLRNVGAARAALLSALLMVSSYSFLFASSVYRNDMLPALLATVGIILLAREAQRLPGPRSVVGHWLGWVAGGLFLGLSASAKANFLVLAAAPVFWLLVIRGRPAPERLRALAALAAGGILGAAPTAAALMMNPEKFLWQVVHYGVQAPLDWYRQIGQASRLGIIGRLSDSALILLQGPALAVLVLLLVHRLSRSAGEKKGGRGLLLELFILAGLVAALLPNPSWRQYFVAPLPALFLRLPAILEAMPAHRRRAASLLLILFALVGAAAFSALLWKSAKDPDRLILSRWRESAWVGEQLRKAGAEGPIASLSPHLALNSGRSIHPRFVSGVFVYRWRRRGNDARILAMGGVTPGTLAMAFAACPPGAIVTGYESGTGNAFRVDLETPLRAYAAAHGYRTIRSPFGKAILHLNPQPTACSAPPLLASG
jgi:hypothetical protein